MVRQRLRSLKHKRRSPRRLIPIRKAFALKRGEPTSTRTPKNDCNISGKLSSDSFKYPQRSNYESDIEDEVDNFFDDKASSDSEASDIGSSEKIEENNLGRYIYLN